jgi:hypothetical protein
MSLLNLTAHDDILQGFQSFKQHADGSQARAQRRVTNAIAVDESVEEALLESGWISWQEKHAARKDNVSTQHNHTLHKYDIA